jgi:hypothetical protein
MIGEIVVCQLFRLARIDGEYVEGQKKLLRNRAVITKDYYEQINGSTKDNGMYYVIDEEATEKYYADSKKQVDARKEVKRIEKLAGKNLVNALDGISKAAINTVVEESRPEKTEVIKKDEPIDDPVVIPDGNPTEKWDLKQIHAWLDALDDGPKYKKTMGIGRMIEEVVNPYLESKSEGENTNDGNTEGENATSDESKSEGDA